MSDIWKDSIIYIICIGRIGRNKRFITEDEIIEIENKLEGVIIKELKEGLTEFRPFIKPFI